VHDGTPANVEPAGSHDPLMQLTHGPVQLALQHTPLTQLPDSH
jgi:hypothetical protein